MPGDFQISYLSHSQVDKEKWDACIHAAGNGLVYAYSFYLNAMAKNWDALVQIDQVKNESYKAVMPLTWNKKYGFYYLYQPAFTASLGVFGKNPDRDLVQQFLDSIPEKFRLIEIDLNAGNYFDHGKKFLTRKNYVLNLDRDYDTLLNAYRENHKRNINRAYRTGCVLKKDLPVEEIVKLSSIYMKTVSSPAPSDYDRFCKLFYLLKEKGMAETYGIQDKKKKLLASAVFFFSHRRAYYILVGNHPDGRTIGASHALVDAFIKDHAGEKIILDFEGSDIHSLAYFYSGFGAREELYPALRVNNLPRYIRWLKK